MKSRRLLVIALGASLALSGRVLGQRPDRQPGRFEAPPLPALAADSFPGLEVRDRTSLAFMALRYGTGAYDTLYFVLDAPTSNAVRDLLQVYAPGPNGLERREVNRGSGATFPQRGGGGVIRGREFKLRNVESTFGPARLRYDLVLSSGFREKDQLHLDARVGMEAPAGRAAYRIGGLLHSYVSPTAEGIKPLALFGEPSLRVGPGEFERDRLTASLSIGGLPVLPGAGMGRNVLVWLAQEGAAPPTRPLRIRWDDRPVLGIRPRETLGSESVRWREGVAYQVRAELDMGPVFGVVTHLNTFRAPSKNK